MKRIARWAAVAATALAAGGGWWLWAGVFPADPSGESFASREKYTLTVQRLTGRAELDLTRNGRSRHSLTLSGFVTAPKDVDAAGVGDTLRVVRAEDARGQDLLEPVKAAVGGNKDKQPPRTAFTAFVNQGAPVALRETPLIANLYALQRLELEAEVIVVTRRESKSLPAAVMENPAEIMPGLKVRVEALKLQQRNLLVTLESRRNSPGVGGPFLEAVYALDKDGREVGGARWSKGSPLAEKEKITATFTLEGADPHASLKLVAATEYHAQPVTFVLTGIFQR